MITWQGNGYRVQLPKSKAWLRATLGSIPCPWKRPAIYQLPFLPVFMSCCSEGETYFVTPVRAGWNEKGRICCTVTGMYWFQGQVRSSDCIWKINLWETQGQEFKLQYRWTAYSSKVFLDSHIYVTNNSYF